MEPQGGQNQFLQYIAAILHWGIAVRTYPNSIPTVHAHSLRDGSLVLYPDPSAKDKSDRSCSHYRLHYPKTRMLQKDNSYYVHTCSLYDTCVASTIPDYYPVFRLYASHNTFRAILYWLHRKRTIHIHHIIHRSGGLADNGKDEPYSNYAVSSTQSPYASVLPLHNARCVHYAHGY